MSMSDRYCRYCASRRLPTRTETCEYPGHRLRIAGSTETPAKSWRRSRLRDSRGNLHAVDNFCLEALELALRKELDAIEPPASPRRGIGRRRLPGRHLPAAGEERDREWAT